MTDNALHLPARDIPIPRSVSPEARAAMLSRQPAAPEPFPPIDDREAWRAEVAAATASMLEMIGSAASSLSGKTDTIDLGDFPVYVHTPDGVAPDDRRVVLGIHGGGFVHLGGEVCRILSTVEARPFRATMWSVDYRMPPDHPYPTPLDDCVTAYRALLEIRRAEEVIVTGGSAGGNLAAALVLRARDEGLPLPAAVVLRTPAADLTCSGDSFHTNRGLDNILWDAESVPNALYAGDHDLTAPYLSPLFGDFTKGFPPTLLTTGTRDLFLSNTVRLHRALRRAGIPAELHVLEAGGHGGFFMSAPEDREIDDEVGRFAEEHWRASHRGA
jgi:epsilon-lactone hydrolase